MGIIEFNFYISYLRNITYVSYAVTQQYYAERNHQPWHLTFLNHVLSVVTQS